MHEYEWLIARFLVDILLVRMTSDVTRPPERRYNYPNAIAGLVSLIKEEGMRGLARGLGTNTVCLFTDAVGWDSNNRIDSSHSHECTFVSPHSWPLLF